MPNQMLHRVRVVDTETGRAYSVMVDVRGEIERLAKAAVAESCGILCGDQYLQVTDVEPTDDPRRSLRKWLTHRL